MFLLIRYPCHPRFVIHGISIHLMFLLIGRLLSCLCIRSRHFNTSHVSINPGQKLPKTNGYRISIHLMFLLILLQWTHGTQFHHFNTSHVSINRRRDHHAKRLQQFQYISCFY